VVKRLAVPFLAIALATSAGPAPAQNAPERQRTVVALKHGSAGDVAAALGEHFKDIPEVRLVPEAGANALLVSAPPAVLAEVLKTIEQLDRRPRQVEIEVIFADITAAGERPEGPALNPRELVGPADGMSARLDALRRQGRLADARHVRLTALEGQKASVNLGKERSLVTSRTTRGGRGGPGGGPGGGAVFAPEISTVERRSTGTLVEALPRVFADGQLKLDLHVEESRLVAPPAGAPEGTPETPSIVQLKAVISVASGRAVLASGVGDEVKAGLPHTVIVVIARIIEPGETGGR
jgi:type II secretory pathway component GspD/PulD (secretin)